jgi:hypothetical protein
MFYNILSSGYTKYLFASNIKYNIMSLIVRLAALEFEY